VGVSNKTIPGGLGTSNAYIAYPNHTVKQNRNYQVGFVLSDRYGRTSSVILSNNPNEITTFGADPSTDYGADTIYHPYKTLDDFDDNHYVWWRNTLSNEETFTFLFYGPLITAISTAILFSICRRSIFRFIAFRTSLFICWKGLSR